MKRPQKRGRFREILHIPPRISAPLRCGPSIKALAVGKAFNTLPSGQRRDQSSLAKGAIALRVALCLPSEILKKNEARQIAGPIPAQRSTSDQLRRRHLIDMPA
jgi:hypothetical protein